ncbi:MAG: hypothetical protein QME83_03035 [Thermodesulfobacteriota bacterium]|nr:hypothetical protein [Thermodesulfobacteriota bacterium]
MHPNSFLFFGRDLSKFREVMEGSILPPNALLLGLDGAVLLSIPEWKGFPNFFEEGNKGFDHLAHWENHFLGGELFCIVLDIKWSNGHHLKLGFIYPHYRRILFHIWKNKRIGLLDKPLKNGTPDPKSRCILVKNLPAWSTEVV